MVKYVTFRSLRPIGVIPVGLLDFLTTTFVELPDVRNFAARARTYGTPLHVCTVGHAHAHHHDGHCAHIRTKDGCIGGTADVVLRITDAQIADVAAQMDGWIVFACDTAHEYECISGGGPCNCDSANGDLHRMIRGPRRAAAVHKSYNRTPHNRTRDHDRMCVGTGALPTAGRATRPSSAFAGAAGRIGRAFAAFGAP